jgi:hypothetical protein
MEYFENMICVTVDDLCYGENPVMTKSNYDNLIRRKQVNVVRSGKGLNCYALVEYASLPERFRYKFEALKGKPEELLREQSAPAWIPISRDARRFFWEEFEFANGEPLTDPKKAEYTHNASMIEHIIMELHDRVARRRAQQIPLTSVWQTIMDTVNKFRYKTPDDEENNRPWHTLPKHLTTLKEKVSQYKKEGYVALVSGKFGNVNTVKITEEGGNFIIALKRSRVPVYSNEQIFRAYNRKVREVNRDFKDGKDSKDGKEWKEWKELKSINSLTAFLNRPEVEPLWWDAVHGELSAKQRYTRKHKTLLPQMRDALWYGDGTKLNLYYKAYENGKLVVRTTAVYEVMDAYSEVLLGYHISDTENWEQQYGAFRMAVERAGCKPYEIVTDNQGGAKKKIFQEFYKRICCVARSTQSYNPQSKSIESVFGRFQSQVLSRLFGFTGTNITAKTGRPNLEFIEANEERLCTLPELKETYKKAREEWNNSLHPATGRPRIDMYLTSTNPETQEIDRLDMIEIFWMTTEKPSTFTNAGITIQVKNREYTYEPLDESGMPDIEFRSLHTNRAFFVQYDPQDMTRVRLFVDSPLGKRFVAEAHPYVEVHRAIQEQEEGERSFIVRQNLINQKERIRRRAAAIELETAYGVAPEQHGFKRPKLKGMSVKRVEELMEDRLMYVEYETVETGKYEKELSNRTWEMAIAYDKF